MPLATVLALALLQVPTAQHPVPDERAGRMDALFAAYTAGETPGCAAGALQDGRWLHARGYGTADLEHDVPVTPETVFNAGSLSKQFTALSVALLAREGRLSLDAPARTYLPELPDAAAAITVGQMIHHTSGLREKWDLLDLRDARDGDLVTQQDVLDLVAAQRALSFQPGTDYVYNNTAYDLLATVVARVSDGPFPAFADARIFGPLGMHRTAYVDSRGAIIEGRATGYWWGETDRRTYMPNTETVGSGGLHTTLEDLAAFDRAFYAGGLGNDLIPLVTTPGRLADGTPLDYAFGLTVDRWRGLDRVHHGGAIAGFKAEVMRFPDQHFSAIVLCNLAQAPAQRYAEGIAEIYLGDRLAPVAPPAARDTSLAFGDRALAARAVGTYRQAQGGFLLRLGGSGDRLRYEVASFHVPLASAGPMRAVAPGRPGVELQFEGEPEEPVRGFRVVWPGFLPSRYERVGEADPSAPLPSGLAGTYRGPELGVAWTVEVEGDSAHLVSPRGRRIALFPAFADGLATADGGWIVTLQRDARGEVDAFLLTMGRSRNIRFERRPEE